MEGRVGHLVGTDHGRSLDDLRQARVLIREKKLPCEFVIEDPWPEDSNIPRRNPLGKVPVLDIGEANYLFEAALVVH